jgi:hypothetical protein
MMAGPTSAAPGRIFISYRRQETAYSAGWLYERLAAHFGRGQLFKDIDSIVPGDDFAEVIANAVGSCDVLLALIGDQWLSIADEDGRSRLANPDDFVRLEIEAALERNVRVIPILVEGARLPRSDELPASLAELVRRQALELSPSRFEFDIGKLLRVLDRTLAQEQAKRGAEAGRVSSEQGGTTGPAEPVAAPATGQRFRSIQQKWLLIALTAVVVLVLGSLAWANRQVVGIGPAGPNPTGPPASGRTPSSTGSEKFREDFTDTSNGWDVLDDTRHRLRYVDGTYQILTKQPGDYYSFPRSRYEQLAALRDVLLEVDARRRSGAEGNGYGVVCRYQDTGDLYWFNITNDGYYGINKKIRGRTVALQRPVRTDAISSTALNHIQATCAQGNGGAPAKLVLWVNGRRIAEVTDREDALPAGGGVGLFAHNRIGGGPADFTFDNFGARRA